MIKKVLAFFKSNLTNNKCYLRFTQTNLHVIHVPFFNFSVLPEKKEIFLIFDTKLTISDLRKITESVEMMQTVTEN